MAPGKSAGKRGRRGSALSRTKTIHAPFPKVAELVKNAVNHKIRLMDRTSHPPSTEEMAQAIGGISQSGVWFILNGERIPREKTAEAMAWYFYKDNPALARKFCEQMRKLREQLKPKRKQAKPASDEKPGYGANEESGLLDDLANDKPLRVRSSPFAPFSSHFINPFFDHLCSLSDLKQYPPEMDMNRDLGKALWGNEIDFASGYLATLKRAKLIHSWSTPIRIGLGAVILKKHEEKLKLVREVLTEKSNLHDLVRPIVVEEQAGAIHCLQRLKYSKNQVVLAENQDPAELKKTLERTAEELSQESSQVTPVVVVNEYSSFKLLEALKPNGMPVMPLSSRSESSRPLRQQLPLFFLSFGCSRRRHDMRDLMEQLLTFFLGTEIESTSAKLLKLYDTLISEVQEFAAHYPEGQVQGRDASKDMVEITRFLLAYHWTFYVLGLDELSLESYPRTGLPWRTILKRTRNKVLEQLADRKDIIRHLMAKIANSSTGALSEEQFKFLCHSLDLHPERLSEVQQEYVLEDRDILLRAIQNILLGQPVGLPIEKGKEGGRTAVVDPRGNRRLLLVADGFMAELQKLYKQQMDESVVQGLDLREQNGKLDTPQNRVEEFRRQVREENFGDEKRDEGVILASVGPQEHSRYIGFACVKPYREKNSLERSLELFYLWVPLRYRKLNVAEHIILKACEFAEKKKYKNLVIEVVQTMNDMVTYFLKRGFLEHGSDGHGRLIFVLPLKTK